MRIEGRSSLSSDIVTINKTRSVHKNSSKQKIQLADLSSALSQQARLDSRPADP